MKKLIYVFYLALVTVIKTIAWIWNKTLAGKINYWIIRNGNDKYCVFRFWIDPNKPTWERCFEAVEEAIENVA